MRDEVIDGYTRVELDAMFKRLHPPLDWKAPIDTSLTVNPSDLHVILKAVAFFTATAAHIEVITATGKDECFVRVRADGYRMGPAGDR